MLDPTHCQAPARLEETRELDHIRWHEVTCTRIRGHGGKCQAVSGWKLLEWTTEPTPKRKR